MPKFLTFNKGDGDSKLEGITVGVFPVKYAYGKWKRDDYCSDVSNCTWGYHHPATGEIEVLPSKYALEHYGTVETLKRGSWGPHARHRSSYHTRYNKTPFPRAIRPVRPVADLFFNDYGDATLVLNALRDSIKSFGYATVGDLRTLVGLQSSFVDQQHGWTNLGMAGIRAVDDDYVIEFPDAKSLEGGS